MATAEAEKINPEPGAQLAEVAESSLSSYLDHIKDRLTRIPATPYFINPRTKLPDQISQSSVSRTSTTTTTRSGSRESTSTVATSVQPLHPSFLVQGFHLSPGTPLNEEILFIWTEQIKHRLKAILLHEISVGTCVQEFMMAGKKPDAMKPAVVVSCGDIPTKKKVVNTFKGLTWLQELLKEKNIMFVVVVVQVRLSTGGTPVPSCTSVLTMAADDILETELHTTLLALEDHDEDEAQSNARPPRRKQRSGSISSSRNHASDLQRGCQQRRQAETVTTTSQRPLEIVITSISYISLLAVTVTVGPSYTISSTTDSSTLATLASPPTPQKPSSAVWIIGPVLGSVLSLLTILLVIFFARRKQRCQIAFDGPEVSMREEDKTKLQVAPGGLLEIMRAGDLHDLEERVTFNLPHELENNEVHELAADETVEPRITKLKNRVAKEFPLPISPLGLLFLMAETQDERAGRIKDQADSLEADSASKAVGESLTTDTLKIPKACSVLHPSFKNSACGLHLLLQGSATQSRRHCTLGGLIIVNGAVFGLTAGHPFKDHLEFCPAEADRDQDLNTSDNGIDEQLDDIEPFVFNEDDSSSIETNSNLPITPSENDSCSLSTSFDPPKRFSTVQVDLTTRESPRHSITIPMTTLSPSFENDHQYLDWGLLETLPYSVSKLPNRLASSDDNKDPVIESTISPPPQGEVKVLIAGSEPQVGYLYSSIVAMRVDEFVFEVCILTLEEPLPLGCSGSWVVYDGQLCGIIVAIREDVPWAYMAPIEPIMEDIKSKLGTKDVRLPERDEVEALSKRILAPANQGGSLSIGN